jgi:thiamine monophosphate synthase
LGEDVGGGGVSFEEADAVFLIEEEVEVAGRVGLDGVELGVGSGGVCGAEKAGED